MSGGRIKELRAQIEHYRKRSGGEAQGGQGLPPRRESGMEEEVGMDFEDEIESRKKLDEQRKKLQKELRDVEKLSCVSKEVQDSLKNDLQQQLREVEQRRHDLMPEHQRAQKRSQMIQSIQDKRRNQQKESTAAQEEMWKIREASLEMRSVFDSCRTRSVRTKWPMQKWQKNFRDCRQEEKE